MDDLARAQLELDVLAEECRSLRSERDVLLAAHPARIDDMREYADLLAWACKQLGHQPDEIEEEADWALMKLESKKRDT